MVFYYSATENTSNSMVFCCVAKLCRESRPFLVQFYVANHAVLVAHFNPKKVVGDTKIFLRGLLQECSLYAGDFLAHRLTRAFLSAYSTLNLKRVEKIPPAPVSQLNHDRTLEMQSRNDNRWDDRRFDTTAHGTQRGRGEHSRGNKRKGHFNKDYSFQNKRGFYQN